MSLLRKQQSRLLGPQKSPSPGLAFGQAGLSTARGEAGCVIRLKWYLYRNLLEIMEPVALQCLGHNR